MCSSVCAGGQLGPIRVSSPLVSALGGSHPTTRSHSGGDPQRRLSPLAQCWGRVSHVLPSPHMHWGLPEDRDVYAWPCSQLLFLAGGQAPSLHDSVGLGTAKYTALFKHHALPGWGHAPRQCWPPPGLVWG